ncbi:Chaperone required for the assembly of the F1-ATPase [Gemmobacter aquatilis]|uniref:Chaperone required for the assembly of the F1-ATPase n=1 Tax=Gemmobacter aquatilis TaxID=933059 RepID=A0A1H8KDB3_9RHOB|nr:ATP12 family protein [Gemmobacter aquatilis]SEN90516.1 Chaperone required for the assembly of the F1-ATPase [Gemmobacter aquatilis]
MSGWTAKRFWKQAKACACEGGHTVRLDGRTLKTPAKTPLVVPTRALAEAIAAEWDAQHGAVRPDTMPATRAANSALDKVATQFAEVADMIAAYGGTDLLCYRAIGPEPLVARQAAGWDPLLGWAAERYGAPLGTTAGVMHIAQPAASLAALSAAVHGQNPFQLAALHDLVAISGSLVLGLAVTEGRLDVDTAFALSRIDEHWQIEQWGPDDEAAALEAMKHQAMRDAARFYTLCQ